MKTKKIGKSQTLQIYTAAEEQCIWMKAGVVNFKLCDNAYDCLHCPFDKAMTRNVRQHKEEVVSWRQAMREKPYAQRECRHMLTGRVDYRLCPNDYRCHVCEYDQGLDEAELAMAPGSVHPQKVAGFYLADSYYYHRGHSWARVEHGGFVRIGVDDFALRLIGHPSAITAPKLGSHLAQTEVGWTLHREKRDARMLSPIEGVVVATNHKAIKDPEQVKHDPFGEGWLAVIDPGHLKRDLKNLFFNQEAAAWLNNESQRLEKKVMESYGMALAATGGEIVDDIYGNLPNANWDDLVHEFLLT